MTTERFRASLWTVRRHPHPHWLLGAFISSAASKLTTFAALPMMSAPVGAEPRAVDQLVLWLLGANDHVDNADGPAHPDRAVLVGSDLAVSPIRVPDELSTPGPTLRCEPTRLASRIPEGVPPWRIPMTC